MGYSKLHKTCARIIKKHKCKFYLAGGIKDIDLINKFKDSGVDDKFESFEKINNQRNFTYYKKL